MSRTGMPNRYTDDDLKNIEDVAQVYRNYGGVIAMLCTYIFALVINVRAARSRIALLESQLNLVRMDVT